MLDTAPGGKPLPAWLFMPPSAAQREALDKVQVFGVDMYANPPKDDEPSQEAEVEAEPASLPESNGHSNGSAQSNGRRDEYDFPEAQGRYSPSQVPPAVTAPRSPSPELPPCPRSHPGQPHIASPRPQTQAQGRFQTPYDSDDGEDEVPVRPAARAAHTTQRPRRSFFASSPQRASSQPTGETDEEDLSDYERERRKARRSARAQADLIDAQRQVEQGGASGPSSLESQAAPAPPATAGVLLPATARSAPGRTSRPQPTVAETAAAALPDSLPPPQSESLTKSQDSGSFDLSRYAAPSAQSAPLPPSSPIASGSHQISSSAPARPQHVLVPTTTDESGPLDQKDGADTGVTDSPALPVPAPAPNGPIGRTTPVQGPAAQRKRPRSSNNTTASGDGDDEASLEKESQRRPRKRAATSNAGLGLGLPGELTPASVDRGVSGPNRAVEVGMEIEAKDNAEVEATTRAEPAPSRANLKNGIEVGGQAEAEAEAEREAEAHAEAHLPTALATPTKLSSWEPPAGQRTPPTAAKSTKRLLLVSEAAELVLPGYRPDLCDLPVPGLSTAWVESARAKAVEVREARERARRERRATTGASAGGGGSGRRGR